MRVGILTSGGDCQALNATMRGLVKALYQQRKDIEIIGFLKGYQGLMYEKYKKMSLSDFEDILNVGGTILGSSRCPFKKMRVIEDGFDKVEAMKKTYKKLKLDCLVVLGGNGSLKSANMLAQEGLNVIGLPKTIDNDTWGTDYTFGFQSAVDIATNYLNEIETTAKSHSRVFVVEIMGHKVGSLTLHAGIAGGADIILIPEIPYDIDKVIDACEKRAQSGKTFSIIAVAEGAMDIAEAAMKKKERAKKRAEAGETTVTNRIAKQIEAATGFESRTVVPGHILRGGSPSAYDRVLATKFGARAAMLIKQEKYGYTVAKIGSKISENKLSDVTMKTKFVPENDELVITGKSIGVSFGD